MPLQEMEDQCSPLSWAYCHQEEGLEELKHSLVYTTLELETTILSAHEEITRREYELIHIKDLLNKTIKERDEAKAKCQKLLLEKFVLQKQFQLQQKQQQQQQQKPQEAIPLCGISSSDDESREGDSKRVFSPLDSDQNVVAPPGTDQIQRSPLPPLQHQATVQLATKKPLPEKGKFLQAVMEAGPLLQTLLLAGPLPQWQHPPPQLDSIEIPPVAISSPSTPPLLHQDSGISNNSCFSNKRGLMPCEGFDSANKYQRVHY